MRSLYNYDRAQASRESGLACSGVQAAQQQFKDECDINTIVKRFGLTGKMPATVAMPMSGDFTEVGDFQSAMNLIRKSQEEFLTLPSAIRQRFANDPGQLIAFLSDVKNREEAIVLGLLPKPVEVARDGTPVPAS